MVLLPYPVSPAVRRVRARRLRQRLQSSSLAEQLEQDLHPFDDWASLRDPLQRRLCRNASLIYSREELRQALLAEYRQLLGHELDGGDDG